MIGITGFNECFKQVFLVFLSEMGVEVTGR